MGAVPVALIFARTLQEEVSSGWGLGALNPGQVVDKTAQKISDAIREFDVFDLELAMFLQKQLRNHFGGNQSTVLGIPERGQICKSRNIDDKSLGSR